MNRTVILTATYNHADRLEQLFQSLQRQRRKGFRWIVVDDGSSDATQEMAKTFEASDFVIEYIRKQNGGKSSALNLAFDRVGTDELAVIIDDDESLDESATEILRRYYDRYYGTDVGILHFLRRNIADGRIIANYPVAEDLPLDYREFKSKGLSADGYVAYFGYAIMHRRFPVFPGEKYVGPGVMMMMAGEEYKMVWANEVLGTTEYLEGGITKQGRRLRVRSPLGMIVYCALYQSEKTSAKLRFKYSVMGFAYQYISGKSKKDLYNADVPIGRLLPLARIPGILLGMKWKRQYLT